MCTISPSEAGYFFSSDMASQFNHVNGITLIARPHQSVAEVFRYMFDKALVAVRSAPSYCYHNVNNAGIRTLEDNFDGTFKVFNAASFDEYAHPATHPPPKCSL